MTEFISEEPGANSAPNNAKKYLVQVRCTSGALIIGATGNTVKDVRLFFAELLYDAMRENGEFLESRSKFLFNVEVRLVERGKEILSEIGFLGLSVLDTPIDMTDRSVVYETFKSLILP